MYATLVNGRACLVDFPEPWRASTKIPCYLESPGPSRRCLEDTTGYVSATRCQPVLVHLHHVRRAGEQETLMRTFRCMLKGEADNVVGDTHIHFPWGIVSAD
jgi:hypothetical protein